MKRVVSAAFLAAALALLMAQEAGAGFGNTAHINDGALEFRTITTEASTGTRFRTIGFTLTDNPQQTYKPQETAPAFGEVYGPQTYNDGHPDSYFQINSTSAGGGDLEVDFLVDEEDYITPALEDAGVGGITSLKNSSLSSVNDQHRAAV
ncbi:hypothetical protein B0H94_10416 [Salsuginibacillus halophilus]|uniref:Uncharacterized protein n=1 Tax=Salsuginibacillus halophilus TaxID=517424 RepID=A0A2P8HQC6_9BACI|nr:hypothetical protein [Salsuginibacillus halophilus]PSL48416.1 hypothetical protein B0H94_10416 [Salsuginibacillus halophilus]